MSDCYDAIGHAGEKKKERKRNQHTATTIQHQSAPDRPEKNGDGAEPGCGDAYNQDVSGPVIGPICCFISYLMQQSVCKQRRKANHQPAKPFYQSSSDLWLHYSRATFRPNYCLTLKIQGVMDFDSTLLEVKRKLPQ